MNKEVRLLPQSLLLWSLLTVPAIGFGHGNNDGHAPEYDPVDKAFGSYSPDYEPTRTIVVEMYDSMRFSPDRITVKAGEVIRFEHTNNGDLMHEFVLGTKEILEQHAEMMKKFPNMEHDEPYMAHVAPGNTGIVVWKFDKPGTYSFGCLIPGHYDAGMDGVVIVE